VFAGGNELFPEEIDTAGLDPARTVNAACTSDAANANLTAAHTSDIVDAADAADADLLEEMATMPSSSTNPEPDQPVEAQTPAPFTAPLVEPETPAPARATEPNTNGSDTSHQVIVEHFPYGRPGAPIIGTDEGVSIYHTSREVFGSSVWAPFHSQCDWEIARWAKMRGPTSSAMEELLAIPEVRAHQLVLIVLLTDRHRLSINSAYHSAPRNS
jgi:hypothetical protein